MWKGWVNGIIGVLLIIFAFIKFSPSAVMWIDILGGLIVAILSILTIKEKSWQGWLGTIAGILLFIVGFIGSLHTGSGHLWTDLILGLLAAIAGFGALGGAES